MVVLPINHCLSLNLLVATDIIDRWSLLRWHLSWYPVFVLQVKLLYVLVVEKVSPLLASDGIDSLWLGAWDVIHSEPQVSGTERA